MLGIAYGASTVETLDIFPGEGDRLPVNVYIHGGYWQYGSKDDCSYVALALGRSATTVVINYGIAPGVGLSGQVAHCRSALRWIWRNIDRYGGDRDRIFLTGHSAGAHLAAMLLSSADRAELMDDIDIKGAVLISGVYELAPIRFTSINDVLNLTDGEVRNLSPLRLDRGADCPMVIAVGALEGAEFIRQSREFAMAWSSPGPQPKFMIVEYGDHFSVRSDWDHAGNWLAATLGPMMFDQTAPRDGVGDARTAPADQKDCCND